MRLDRYGYGAIAFRDTQPLHIDIMKQYAPSLFAKHAAQGTSDKYRHIPTVKVIDALAKETGYVPFSVRVSGARYRDNNYAKHEIRFRRDDQRPLLLLGSIIRELVLTNSHDGTSSYVLDSGLFRLVCENGLMVATSQTTGERVRHVGTERVVAQLIENALRIAKTGKTIVDIIAAMQGRELTHEERIRLAETASFLRWGRDPAPITARRLLHARRTEDQRDNLWTTMNVIQENVERGGIGYTMKMKNGEPSVRRTRPIRNIASSQDFNKALWKAAEGMLT